MDENRKIDISAYIQEIGERLGQGHASVMIGAGFSRNAKKQPSIQDAPDWKALGDLFLRKLGIHADEEYYKKEHYMNVSKLAEQIEIVFGRPALEQILTDAIPDGKYEPSDIHKNLLKLPWVDVFTTNYDTLLERAADSVIERKYETIVNKEDLPRSSKPRIIKLHGSFPSTRPFIITEEDYRTYPQDFAPFVNTVQQSLLENTFCLIGFSASDPNFLKWIGWIRDNLGCNAPKIYMLSVDPLSTSEELWMNKHNINCIELTYFEKEEKPAKEKRNTSTELEEFLTLLEKIARENGASNWEKNEPKKKKNETDKSANIDIESSVLYERVISENEDKQNWAKKQKYTIPRRLDNHKELQPQYEKIVQAWQESRETYPNWLILSAEDRDAINSNTNYNSISSAEKLDSPHDLMFLYEFNWRLEKMLSPIDNNWINIYKSIVKRYNPYDIVGFENDSAITPTNTAQFEDTNWQEIKGRWIELQLAILRYYREEGKYEEWGALDKIIATIQDKLSEDAASRYQYERCLYSLFRLNIEDAKENLEKWTITSLLSPWIIRKAGLMAEVGMVAESSQRLTEALKAIREQLHLAPNNIDYALLSQEAYIMWMLPIVEWSVSHQHDNAQFKNRLNELKQYKCDPEGDQRSFQINSTNIMPVEKRWGFGVGEYTTVNHLDRTNPTIKKSYTFLRYMEEIGIPPRVTNATFYNKDIIENAIVCVAEYSPAWGFASCNRYILKEDTINKVWGRKMLSFTTVKEADHYANFYLSKLKECIEILRDNKEEYSYITSRKAFFCTVLSHLTVKCSENIKKKMLELLRELYKLDNTHPEEQKAVKSLAKFLFRSFSVSTIMTLLPELLDFSIISNDRTRLIEVFDYIPTPEHFPKVKPTISQKKVDNLIELLSTDSRDTAIKRLYVLNAYGLLNKSSLNRFAKALWKDIDENSLFPKNKVYYYFAFVTSLPYPEDKAPVELLHQYINKVQMPIQSRDGKQGIGFSNGNYSRFHNILGTVQCSDYVWSKDEINTLLQKLIEWWNTDKSYLKDEERIVFLSSLSVAQEFRLRFQNMIWVFKEIMTPYVALIDKQYYLPIRSILDELEEYDMPDCVAKAAFIELFHEESENLVNHLYLRLYSDNEDKCQDALDAVKLLSSSNHLDIVHLLESITQILKCRTSSYLNHYIYAIRYIIENHSDVLNTAMLEDIALCMHYLLDEVAIKQNDTVDMVQKKLINKESAIWLAISLENYYMNRSDSVPDYISAWKEQVLKDDEFADLRNIWVNAIDVRE
jgi:hypothetical protein